MLLWTGFPIGSRCLTNTNRRSRESKGSLDPFSVEFLHYGVPDEFGPVAVIQFFDSSIYMFDELSAHRNRY